MHALCSSQKHGSLSDQIDQNPVNLITALASILSQNGRELCWAGHDPFKNQNYFTVLWHFCPAMTIWFQLASLGLSAARFGWANQNVFAWTDRPRDAGRGR